MRRDMRLPRSGFTLIELLVVISIIAVLAAMLLPTIGMVKDQARSLSCKSHLRQIAMVVHAYAADNDNAIPKTVTFCSQPNRTLFEPYVEANNSTGSRAYELWQCTVPALRDQSVWGGWLCYYLNWGAIDDSAKAVPGGRSLSRMKRSSESMFCYDGDLGGNAGYHRWRANVLFMDGRVTDHVDDSCKPGVAHANVMQDPGPTVFLEYVHAIDWNNRSVKGWDR